MKYCDDCGIPIGKSTWNAVYCQVCRVKHMKKGTQSPKKSCGVIVRYAVKGGILPKLDGSIGCIDCGEPAKHYDHRDYMKPLDVDPVCHSCNMNRGKGINGSSK